MFVFEKVSMLVFCSIRCLNLTVRSMSMVFYIKLNKKGSGAGCGMHGPAGPHRRLKSKDGGRLAEQEQASLSVQLQTTVGMHMCTAVYGFPGSPQLFYSYINICTVNYYLVLHSEIMLIIDIYNIECNINAYKKRSIGSYGC
jgi:hypothetical protein